MSRKLLLLSVAVFLLFGSISSTLAGTTTLVKTLTMDEAIQLAQENNIDLKKAKLDYDGAIIDAQQAQHNAGEIDGDTVNSLQTAQTKYVTTKQRALAEDIAKQTYEIAKEQTKNLVEEKYYEVLKAENLIKVREAAVERSEVQLTLAEKKYKAGTAIKIDVNQARISLDSAKADLVNAQRDYKNAQIALNKLLGLEVNTDLKLTQVLKYEAVELPTSEELKKQALEKRIDLRRTKNAQEIAQANYDLVVAYQAPNTFSAKKQKIELDNANLDVLQQEQNIKAEIISILFQVQKADEVVQLAAKNLEQAKENQNLAQRRYEIGVGSITDILSASADLANTESKYIEAVYNYTTTKNKLNTIMMVAN